MTALDVILEDRQVHQAQSDLLAQFRQGRPLGSAPDRNCQLKMDGQCQLDGRRTDGLFKQFVNRALPFQLHNQVRVHPTSLCAAGTGAGQ